MINKIMKQIPFFLLWFSLFVIFYPTEIYSDSDPCAFYKDRFDNHPSNINEFLTLTCYVSLLDIEESPTTSKAWPYFTKLMELKGIIVKIEVDKHHDSLVPSFEKRINDVSLYLIAHRLGLFKSIEK